jgi:hypothetical protein
MAAIDLKYYYWYVLCNSSKIYTFGTLTLRPPTNRPHDILTHTIHPPNILSTVTIFYCDTSTMWHFSTVIFRLCDNFLLPHFDYVTFFYCDIPTLWQFPTVTLRPYEIFLLWHSDSGKIFYCEIPSQSRRIVRPPQEVDVLSHCDIPTHCNFGQPMAVTFCPLRISISPVDTLSKLPPILTDDDLVTLSL